MRCISDLSNTLPGVLAGNTLSGAFDLYGFQATSTSWKMKVVRHMTITINKAMS